MGMSDREYRQDDQTRGYCPHCGEPVTMLGTRGHCERHGYVWAGWTGTIIPFDADTDWSPRDETPKEGT